MSKKRKSEKQQPTDPSDPFCHSATTGPDSANLPNSNQDSGSTNISASKTNQPETIPQKGIVSRYVSFGLLLGVIVLLGFAFYEVMASFLVPLFLAALLVVVFRPLHRWVAGKMWWSAQLGALLTTAAILLVVLIPLSTLLLLALVEGREASHKFQCATKLSMDVRTIRTNLRLDMPSAGHLDEIELQLEDLQQTTVLREYEIEQHRSSLFIIEENAKEFAADTNTTWPVAVNPDRSADNPNDHWEFLLPAWRKPVNFISSYRW